MENVWFDVHDDAGASEFLGYDTEVAEGVVAAILKNGKPADRLDAGESGMIVANQTPFYAESGGQMGDNGVMVTADGAVFMVEDTLKRLDDLHVHIGTLQQGSLQRLDAVEMRVDRDRRSCLQGNHSVTHILHATLRERLGVHVSQKGSLVSPEYLRFDFSHRKPVDLDELTLIEAEVNRRIRENVEVVTRQMTPDEAQDAGATALFGEKYGEEVRVVSMGKRAREERDLPYSMELCGGIHVTRTGDIGFFKIMSETAVASGVRRIEAVTGAAAHRYVCARDAIIAEAAKSLNAAPGDIPARVGALLQERRVMEREMADLRRKLAEGGGNVAPEVRDVNGMSMTARLLEDVPAKELKPLVDSLKGQLGSGIVAVVSVSDGKASLVVGVTDDLIDRVSAVDLVRAGSVALGGKGGGGRPDMAQAGGPNGNAADAALTAIAEALANAD